MARFDFPAPGLSHGANKRPESSAAYARRAQPRLTSGGQGLAHQPARVVTVGPYAGTLPHDSMKPWDGTIGAGDEEQSKVQGFSSIMIAVCAQKGISSVLEQEKAVKVGLEQADRAALVAEHSEEVMRKSYELWGVIIQRIPHAPVMRMNLSAGSPREG